MTADGFAGALGSGEEEYAAAEHAADSDAAPHDSSGHDWWECEVCHQRVSDILDARLRKGMLAEGYSEHDADLMLAAARDTGRRLREGRILPPGEGRA